MADADGFERMTALSFIEHAAAAAAQGQVNYEDFLAQHVKDRYRLKLKSGRHLIALQLGEARIIQWQGKMYVFLHDRVHYLKFDIKGSYGEIKVITASYVQDSVPYFIFAVSLAGQFYSTGPQPHPTIAGEVFNSMTGLEIFSTSDGTACMAFGISHKIVWDQLKNQKCYAAVFRQSKLPKNPQFPRHNSSPITVQHETENNDDDDDMDLEESEDEGYVDLVPQQIASPGQQKRDIVALMSQMNQEISQGRQVENFWDVIRKFEALGYGFDSLSLWPMYDSNLLPLQSDLTNDPYATMFSESDPRVPVFDDDSEDLLADSVDTIERDKE